MQFNLVDSVSFLEFHVMDSFFTNLYQTNLSGIIIFFAYCCEASNTYPTPVTNFVLFFGKLMLLNSEISAFRSFRIYIQLNLIRRTSCTSIIKVDRAGVLIEYAGVFLIA